MSGFLVCSCIVITANRGILRSNLTAVIILQQFHSPCVNPDNILLQAVRDQSKQSCKMSGFMYFFLFCINKDNEILLERELHDIKMMTNITELNLSNTKKHV